MPHQPDPLTALLAERGVLLADGATGTNLFNMGLMAGEPPEFWNTDHPDRMQFASKPQPDLYNVLPPMATGVRFTSSDRARPGSFPAEQLFEIHPFGDPAAAGYLDHMIADRCRGQRQRDHDRAEIPDPVMDLLAENES